MKVVRNVINISVIVILLVVIFICSVVIFDSVKHPDEIPSFFGWKPFIITENKVDDIEEGDVVLVKEWDTLDLKVNDVIAYRDKANLVTICKINSIDDDIMTVTVDTLDDEINIIKEQVEGKYMHRIAFLGTIALEIQKPMVAGICLSLPIIILLTLSLIDYKKEKEEMELANAHQKELQDEINRLKKQNAELKKKTK